MNRPLIEVDDLRVHYAVRGLGRKDEAVRAVDGISFSVGRGQTLALVGESGCGKSTAGFAISGLVKATSGRVLFKGRDILDTSRAGQRALARAIQLVFQDPSSALDPRMRIRDSIIEPMAIQGVGNAAARMARARELMALVGLPEQYLTAFPRNLSGGQRQRVVIARALTLEPDLLICDEAVSALDVSIRSQILNLFMELQQRLGLSYIFISHDLSVVRHIADQVAVMYLGRIVEAGTTDEIFNAPRHPYTQALLSAIPIPDPKRRQIGRRVLLTGELPSPREVREGCGFASRCPVAMPICRTQPPPRRTAPEQQSWFCHLEP